MAHLQVHVDKALLKEVKKTVIDQDTSIKDYTDRAFRTQLEIDKESVKKEKEQTTTNLNKEI